MTVLSVLLALILNVAEPQTLQTADPNLIEEVFVGSLTRRRRKSVGCPKCISTLPQRDGLAHAVQLCLDGKANGNLLGEASKLGKLGHQLSGSIVLDVEWHQRVWSNIRKFN